MIGLRAYMQARLGNRLKIATHALIHHAAFRGWRSMRSVRTIGTLYSLECLALTRELLRFHPPEINSSDLVDSSTTLSINL